MSRWAADDPDLAARIEQAEAVAIRDRLAVITKAADSGTWQAAAWFLERRYPEQWGRRTPKPETSDFQSGEVVLRWADDPGLNHGHAGSP